MVAESLDYEWLKNRRNESNRFANKIGAYVEEMGEGYAISRMHTGEDCLNPGNSLHGGAMFTVADIAAGAAAGSFGQAAVTQESSFHYLRAGKDTREITGRARVVKRGKRAIIIRVSVYDQDEVLLCEGIFTFTVIDIPGYMEKK